MNSLISLCVGVLALAFLSQVSAQPDCVELQFQTFSVNVADDSRQLLLLNIASVGSSYPYTYSGTLSQCVTDGITDLNIVLDGPQATFAVSLNGAYITNSDSGIAYYASVAGGNDILFNGFLGTGVTAVNNTVLVNINQTIAFPNAINLCNYIYTFYITNPACTTNTLTPPISGDPQFFGLRGQSYQVHGIDKMHYSLLSDAEVQLNSQFVFLTGPRPCPTIPGTHKRAIACWTHPGSYLGSIGLMTSYGDMVKVVSGPAAHGFSIVAVNGKSLKVGSSSPIQLLDVEIPIGFVVLNSTHEMTIRIGPYYFVFENSDSFLNMRVFNIDSSYMDMIQAHGLIGQTWQNKMYASSLRYIEGDVEDYVVSSLFSYDSVFNRFNPMSEASVYPNNKAGGAIY